jgi:hypothetical protein
VYENGFLDHSVSAIFEFSGNEFELGRIKLREKANQLSSADGPLKGLDLTF